MIVLIEEIGAKGLEVERELTAGFLKGVLDGAGTGFRPLAPSKLEARLEKVSGKLLLTAHSAIQIGGSCKRCLGAAQSQVPVDFQLSLVRQVPAIQEEEGAEDEAHKKDEEGAGGSFDTMAVEEEPFDGRTIDLGKIFSEQLLLDLPMDLVCREGCKGLCTVCGKDLNEGECSCERKPPDPRWAALKDIKIT